MKRFLAVVAAVVMAVSVFANTAVYASGNLEAIEREIHDNVSLNVISPHEYLGTVRIGGLTFPDGEPVNVGFPVIVINDWPVTVEMSFGGVSHNVLASQILFEVFMGGQVAGIFGFRDLNSIMHEGYGTSHIAVSQLEDNSTINISFRQFFPLGIVGPGILFFENIHDFTETTPDWAREEAARNEMSMREFVSRLPWIEVAPSRPANTSAFGDFNFVYNDMLWLNYITGGEEVWNIFHGNGNSRTAFYSMVVITQSQLDRIRETGELFPPWSLELGRELFPQAHDWPDEWVEYERWFYEHSVERYEYLDLSELKALLLGADIPATIPAVQPDTPEAPPAQAADITVLVNGVEMSFTNPPLVRHGFTFFQVDDILEALADSINWNADTATISGTSGGNLVEVQVHDLIYIVNGTVLDSPPELAPFVENGLIYVYIDFIIEGLGLSASWDGETRTFSISN